MLRKDYRSFIAFMSLMLFSIISYSQPPQLGNFTFGQVDWYARSDSPTPIASNSSWGFMKFGILSNFSEIHYLNVIANTNMGNPDGWIIRNLPIFPDSSPYQGVDFDISLLGLENGEQLPSITFCYTVSSEMVENDALLPCVPTSDSLVTVKKIKEALSTGLEKDDIDDIGNIISLGKKFSSQSESGSVKEESEPHDVPPVGENENGCLPGAFARSIAWLDQEYKLNLGKSAQDIYDELAEKIGHKDKINKPTDERIDIKREYLKNLVEDASNGKKSAVTKKWTPKDGDLCTWMLKEMETEDVEFGWLWFQFNLNESTGDYEQAVDEKGNPIIMPGHAVTVSKIAKFDNGDCNIHYRDDEQQGDTDGNGNLIPDDGQDRIKKLRPDERVGEEIYVSEDGKQILVPFGVLGVSESIVEPLEKCDEPQETEPTIAPNQSSGSFQIGNLMDGSCQSLLISQPTGNSLKSVSLAPPYDSSNVQLSEVGAIINLAPLFGRGKTMNINFELNSPAEPNTVISVTCPCPLDVKLSSFNATLEAAKEQVALTWEILEGNNAYLNIWGAQLEANEFKNVTQFNTQPIPIDETVPFMNFFLNTSQLNPGATYFALESVSYEGECVTYCDDIDAVVLGPVEVDLESVKNLCKQEMKHQIAVFGNTGSCVK